MAVAEAAAGVAAAAVAVAVAVAAEAAAAEAATGPEAAGESYATSATAGVTRACGRGATPSRRAAGATSAAVTTKSVRARRAGRWHAAWVAAAGDAVAAEVAARPRSCGSCCSS